jgi:hypothetical protein
MFDEIKSKLRKLFEGDEGQIIIRDRQFEIWKTQFGRTRKFKYIIFEEIRSILAKQYFPVQLALLFYDETGKCIGSINEDMKGWNEFLSIVPNKFKEFRFDTLDKTKYTDEQFIEVWSKIKH